MITGKIYIDKNSLGNATNADAENYLSYVKHEISTTYPDNYVAIIVGSGNNLIIGEDENEECEFKEFLHRLWDNCPDDVFRDITA